MAAFFDGHIASIKPEIMEDIEEILEFIRSLDENDEWPPKKIMSASERVEGYIATYNANELKDD